MSRKTQIADPLLKEAKDRSLAVEKIDEAASDHFWQLGEHLDAVHSKKLFKVLGIKSLKLWMQRYVPASRRKAYDAMKCWRELKEIPKHIRKDLPIQNAKIMAKHLPESKRRSEKWIKLAMEKTEADFMALVEAQKVGAEKSEEMIVKHLKFEKSAWEKIQETIDYLINFHDVKSTEEAIEMMAANAIFDFKREHMTCEDSTQSTGTGPVETPEGVPLESVSV